MTLRIERYPLLLGLQDLLILSRLDGGLDLIPEFRQARERHASQTTRPGEIAAGDQVLVGVAREPALAGAKELVDLVGALPVVLGLVQNGQQHVQLAECVSQPDNTGEAKPDVARVTPVGERVIERDRLGVHGPTQRLEDPVCDHGATAARQHRDHDLQRDGRVGKLLLRVAATAPSGAEHVGHGDAEQRRRSVRAVVDVLGQAEVRGVLRPRPRQPNRIYVQHQRDGAPLLRGLGVEHRRGAERLLELLDPVGVLVQQEPKVGSRVVGSRNG